MWFALGLFLLTYVLMIALPNWRWLVATIAAIIFVGLSFLPLDMVLTEINWNVLLMILGTMGIVSLFIESRMPAKLADIIIDRSPNEKWVIILLSVFAGIISAFVDNVATVLMVAPLAITIAKKLGTSPVPAIIAISVASNLEGAATLVGDTTSILLGTHADMTFFDFFWYQGRPGLFFINQIGLIAATFILMYLFRHKTASVTLDERTSVTSMLSTYALLLTIVLLIVASFVDLGHMHPFISDNINGLICVAVLAVLLFLTIIRERSIHPIVRTLKEVDYPTLVLLASLFIIIGGIREQGVIKAIGDLFMRIGGDSPFLMYSLLVWASVLFSAFIDNIPYVMTMLPVVTALAAEMSMDPTVFYFGLLCGATLGGNLTPIGASANIASLGILRKEGHSVSAGTFMKISVPYTLVAVSVAYVLVWLMWGL